MSNDSGLYDDPVWQTADGRKLHVKEFDDEHLHNTNSMLRRRVQAFEYRTARNMSAAQARLTMWLALTDAELARRNRLVEKRAEERRAKQERGRHAQNLIRQVFGSGNAPLQFSFLGEDLAVRAIDDIETGVDDDSQTTQPTCTLSCLEPIDSVAIAAFLQRMSLAGSGYEQDVDDLIHSIRNQIFRAVEGCMGCRMLQLKGCDFGEYIQTVQRIPVGDNRSWMSHYTEAAMKYMHAMGSRRSISRCAISPKEAGTYRG